MEEKVSVVIPVYNEEKEIKECLKSLEKQTHKNLEILIIDDGSTDNTLEVIKDFNVRLFKQNHNGPGKARNLGARKAKGSILIFVDADMTFDKDYIKKLISPLKAKKIIGASHETELVNNLKNVWSKCWGRVRVSKENAKDVKIFRAIKKNKFLEIGGFDSKYGYADDQTFWFKYKIKPVVAAGAVCYHKNPETLASVYKQSRWIGASIENRALRLPLINYFLLVILAVFSPLAIVVLALKKSSKQDNFRLLFPWMILFMTARYFGTIKGIFRKIYLNKNVK